MSKVELNIVALANSESKPGNYTLILEEERGKRRLPIVIGSFEAQSLAIVLEKMQTRRPLTHDLFKNTLSSLGIDLKEVVISQLVEGIFHALLVCVKENGELVEIDARSSDAIALAVRFHCPIYARNSVIEAAGVVSEERRRLTPRMKRGLDGYSEEELENLLEKVLEKEDYENAARIRDAIKRKREDN